MKNRVVVGVAALLVAAVLLFFSMQNATGNVAQDNSGKLPERTADAKIRDVAAFLPDFQKNTIEGQKLSGNETKPKTNATNITRTGGGGGGGGGSPPAEKIQPALKSEIQKKPDEKVKVLLHVSDDSEFEKVSSEIEKAGGSVSGSYSVGSIVVAEIPGNKVQSIASGVSVVSVWQDTPVYAMLEQSVPQIEALSLWAKGYTGKGIKIAVLDTGIDSRHEILRGKVVKEKIFTGEGSSTDVYGHGTHVAGIAAGNGTLKGVAPDVLLYNAKVLGDSGSGSMSGIIAAINWAVDPDGDNNTDDGADVIIMSLGSPECSNPFASPESLAIKDATERGVLVVVAAGNCGELNCASSNCGSYLGVTTPGCSPYALTVGSVDKRNEYVCYSSYGEISGYGTKPDVVAPGEWINSSVPGGGYSLLRGTSMAAPHVAGAAALLLEANPKLNPSQIKKLIELNALDLGPAGRDVKHGSGLVKLGKIIPPKIGLDENVTVETPISRQVKKRVKMNNTGAKDLVISNATHDGRLKVSLTSSVVQPVTDEYMDIEFNPASFGLGKFSENIAVETNDRNATVRVSIDIYQSDEPIIYSFNLSRIIFRGEEVLLAVNTTDNKGVKSVSVVFTAPNNSAVAVQLDQREFLWDKIYRFPADAMLGNYTATVFSSDADNHVTNLSALFELTDYIVAMPGEFTTNRQYGFSARYKNTDTISHEVESRMEISEIGGDYRKTFGETLDMRGDEEHTFNFTWASGEPKDYTLRIEFLEDGTRKRSVFQKNFTVFVPDSVEITSFVSPQQSEKGSAAEFQVTAKNNDSFAVNASVEIRIESSGKSFDVFGSDISEISPASEKKFILKETMSIPGGIYSSKASIIYGNRRENVTKQMNVTVPRILRIVSSYVPTESEVNKEIPVSIAFENPWNMTIGVHTETVVYKDNDSYSIVDMGYTDVPAASQKTLNGTFVAKKTGYYSVSFNVFYEGNYDSSNQTIRIIDKNLPKIDEISFNNKVKEDEPFIIRGKVSDDSSVKSVETVSENVTCLPVVGAVCPKFPNVKGSLFRFSDSSYDFEIKIVSNVSSVPFKIKACDEFDNCVFTNVSKINVEPCTKEKVLLVDSDNDFEKALNSTYCPIRWDKKIFGQPNLEHMKKFPAVIWSEGNDQVNIDDADADLLKNYTASEGKLLLEGEDIASRHIDDDFMKEVAHAVITENVLTTQSLSEINVTRRHPVVEGLSALKLGNLSASPETVTPANGGVEIASWGSGKSSLVAYEGSSRVLFMPFLFDSLVDSEKKTLANNTLKWLIEKATDDSAIKNTTYPTFISAASEAEFSLELKNPYELFIFLENYTPPKLFVSAYVDGIRQKTVAAEGKRAKISLLLIEGNHEIEFFINPEFAIAETTYFNNSMKINVSVAPAQSRLVTLLSVPESTGSGNTTKITANISNAGGATTGYETELFVENKSLGKKTGSIIPGSTQSQEFLWKTESGVHELVAQSKDVSRGTTERYTSSLYGCNNASVLVVEDNDAPFVSGNGSSVEDTLNILKSGGYCFKTWKQSEKGMPSKEEIKKHDIVIWSAGDYWGGVLNATEASLLSEAKRIIIEGSDIAFDNSNFTVGGLSVSIDKDIIAEDSNYISTTAHKITSGIGRILINSAAGPYPDSVTSNSIEVARWNSGKSAIVAYQGSQKIAYMAFSLDSVSDAATRSRLLLNTISWLSAAQAFEEPPGIRISVAVIKGTSQNYESEASIVSQPLGGRASENYIVDLGFLRYFGG